MKSRIPLAWLQLSRANNRMVVAIAGIAFADILMFMQMGFKAALYNSNTLLHRRLCADLVLISPQARNLTGMSTFPRRRLYQAMSFDRVKSADALYIRLAEWKAPITRFNRLILVLGFNPTKPVLNLPEVNQNLDKIKLPNVLLFDRGARNEYSATVAELEKGRAVFTEFRGRQIKLNGLFKIGASFAADGILIASDQTFFSLFSRLQTANEVNIGLIALKPNSAPKQIAAILQASLPQDVKVFTRAEFIEFEKKYWANNTPIGFIFNLGTALGFFVGLVIFYQILYNDISERLPEYATLKAIGYGDTYLLAVVFQQALILAVLGYMPGCAISFGLYSLTINATNLPLFMTLEKAALILGLTVLMCSTAGAIAMKKIRDSDPVDVLF